MPAIEDALIKLVKDAKEKAVSATTEDERKKIFTGFKEAMKALIKANRSSAMDITIKVLESLTDERKTIDPSVIDRDMNIWRWCWAAFLELSDPVAAERIVEDCYLHLLRLQVKNSKRYHKGMPLQTRAEGLIWTGRYERAKKFVLLAHIEDIITGLRAAPAWQTLKLAGASDQDLKLVEDETKILIKKYSKKPILYPEEVYQRVQYKLEFGRIPESSKELVFTNSIFLNELLDRVEKASKSADNQIKRESMEKLAQYLFSSIEGLYVEPSKKAGPYELDGIITNISPHPFLKTLDNYVPIECKNWREPIGSPEITQFLGKLSLFQCRFGILLSKEGIKERTVNELRKDACRRSGIYVLVFDKNDIKSIVNGKDLVSLLVDKFKELKFSINI